MREGIGNAKHRIREMVDRDKDENKPGEITQH